MGKYDSVEKLEAYAQKIRENASYKDPIAFAIGRVNLGQLNKDKILSVDYACVNYNSRFIAAAILLQSIVDEEEIEIDFSASEFVYRVDKKIIKRAIKYLDVYKELAIGNEHRNLQTLYAVEKAIKDENGEFCFTFLFEDSEPKSIEAVYLKLYMLSQKLVPLKSLNLNGAFKILPNVAWNRDNKPIELEYLRQNEIKLKMNGNFPAIAFVDKFPRFLAHIIPEDSVRILDDAKVRMGAVLAGGTTVMPGASYINFNSGTTGAVMVEGRISSSVVVGEGSDVGGGASILGVLSGTNGNAVEIGKRCLLGANSVTGIPYGDDCIIDAGIAILEGTKVYVSQNDRDELKKINPEFDFSKEIYKALELAKLNGLHFRMNSQTGQIVASVSKRAIKLNKDLH